MENQAFVENSTIINKKSETLFTWTINNINSFDWKNRCYLSSKVLWIQGVNKKVFFRLSPRYVNPGEKDSAHCRVEFSLCEDFNFKVANGNCCFKVYLDDHEFAPKTFENTSHEQSIVYYISSMSLPIVLKLRIACFWFESEEARNYLGDDTSEEASSVDDNSFDLDEFVIVSSGVLDGKKNEMADGPIFPICKPFVLEETSNGAGAQDKREKLLGDEEVNELYHSSSAESLQECLSEVSIKVTMPEDLEVSTESETSVVAESASGGSQYEIDFEPEVKIFIDLFAGSNEWEHTDHSDCIKSLNEFVNVDNFYKVIKCADYYGGLRLPKELVVKNFIMKQNYKRLEQTDQWQEMKENLPIYMEIIEMILSHLLETAATIF